MLPQTNALSVLCLFLSLASTVLSQPSPNVTTLPNATWPSQVYKTEPLFHPPLLNITKTGNTAPGYIFLAPDGSHVVETAPLIMTDTNELIWQGPSGHAFNLGVQMYNGEPVLAYWNGTVFPEPVGRGYGQIHLLNSSYQEIAVVSLPGDFLTSNGTETFPSNIDLHELYITPNNTVIVTANNVTTTDLSSVGGPNPGWVVDGLVYEIDIATNAVLFSWSALAHVSSIPLTASLFPLGFDNLTGTSQDTAWGYFHINAVTPYSSGYLVSSRYTCSIFHISATGTVLWILQGQSSPFSTFALSPDAHFCFQHDIRVESTLGGLRISMHDNANSPLTLPLNSTSTPSSGLSLDLNTTSNTSTLGQRFLNPSNPIYSTAQGNFQRLPDANVFMGHGFSPVMEEFNGTGSAVLTMQFGALSPPNGTAAFGSSLSYRAFRQPWTGCPNTMPAVVAEATASGQTAVYMSWNGATEVASWDVWGGASAANLTLLAQNVTKTGFETEVVLAEAVAYVAVDAILVEGCGCDDCGSASSSKAVVRTV